MQECLITFRSVMPAQRGEMLLQNNGIGCSIRRTPKWMERQGCGYSLQLPCEHVPQAVGLLRGARISYRKLYRTGDGKPEEMRL